MNIFEQHNQYRKKNYYENQHLTSERLKALLKLRKLIPQSVHKGNIYNINKHAVLNIRKNLFADV